MLLKAVRNGLGQAIILADFVSRPRKLQRSAEAQAMNDPQARQALLEGGGKVKVPCLRIEENGQVRWMYESSEIIAYLEGRFANA